MKKDNSNHELMFPILPHPRLQKTMKDILKDLKTRKIAIEERIKSQERLDGTERS
jgi:hypothetical protein